MFTSGRAVQTLNQSRAKPQEEGLGPPCCTKTLFRY